MVLDLSKVVKKEKSWLSLIVGNTRLHWGFFRGEQLVSTWHTPPLTPQAIRLITQEQFQHDAWQSIADSLPRNSLPKSLPTQPISSAQLWIASAVPHQTLKWIEAADEARIVHNSHIPMDGLYGTLGCDRAINLLGAGNTVGWPVLVIDAGTALTFTAGIETSKGKASFYGGAILPGVRLQQQALGEQTAALTEALALSQSIFASAGDQQNSHGGVEGVPERWATDTSSAIASGLVYGMLSSITDYLCDWWQRFPTGKAIMTGGDGPRLYALLRKVLMQENRVPLRHSSTQHGSTQHTDAQQQRTPEIRFRVLTDCTVDTDLMFRGMQAYRQRFLENYPENLPTPPPASPPERTPTA